MSACENTIPFAGRSVSCSLPQGHAGDHQDAEIHLIWMNSPVDLVNHPPHYSSHPSGVECIQITEHMGFNLGNAVKYIWRADEKGSALEDLKKAEWYIRREIDRRSKA